jgi:ABC-type bacteriocin/lantibiotic exporter with double-glycine peptidase domain
VTRSGVKVIAQRKPWDCGVAALAMLLGRPYGDVSASVRRVVVGYRKGMTIRAMEAVSQDLGTPLKRVYKQKHYLANATGILGLLWGTSRDKGHWVVVKGGAIVDPDGGEVWDAIDYMTKHEARPATLLVREDA